MQDIRKPDSAFIASTPSRKTPSWPQNTCKFFRVSLESQQALSTSNGNVFAFHINAPQELHPGRWCMCVDNIVLAGDAVPTANESTIIDFHVASGLPIRHSYDCTTDGESTSIACVVRTAENMHVMRSVSNETLGIPLNDLGQLRQRRVTINILNGNGVLHTEPGLSHWKLGVCFYLLDSD